MFVVKRDGKKEPVKFDKITARIEKLCYGLNAALVDPIDVAKKVIEGLFDGVTTSELDNLAAETAASLTTKHPDYALLASRIAVSNLHKNTIKSFSETMKLLYNYIDPKNGKNASLLAEDVWDIIEKNAEERQKLLTLVIAGGGATGVEIAGMLAEMRRYIYVRDYPELKDYPCEIYIVNSSADLLEPMSVKTHKAAYRALDELGVHIRLNTRVIKFEDDRVHLSCGEIIPAKTLIWSAGVIANTIDGIPDKVLGKGSRLLTDCYNRLHDYPNIFAIGDLAIQLGDPSYPTGHPQLAQPAIQQGKALARNLCVSALVQRLD